MNALIRVAQSALPEKVVDPEQHRRQIIADLCRLVGKKVNGKPSSRSARPPLPSLSPRMRQTLERLLAGDGEKQIAYQLGLSRHTVHVYIKALYRGFEVSSRGELLAKFIQSPELAAQKQSEEST
ncbi:MAG TPA: LuxR C-terminal-related transcriptional regulator [Tepidisphaeraceae bacterium]|nr:LuxR C-terminal-related transcriptional regulator [Tepidisphaeraceae bacterium]